MVERVKYDADCRLRRCRTSETGSRISLIFEAQWRTFQPGYVHGYTTLAGCSNLS
jgi:hypothetical protein